MTPSPKEKATELLSKFYMICQEFTEEIQCSIQAQQCALIAVQYIITSNPHSNPFNTDVHSTMDYWEQVKAEIENYDTTQHNTDI
jgi:hypothetical protein